MSDSTATVAKANHLEGAWIACNKALSALLISLKDQRVEFLSVQTEHHWPFRPIAAERSIGYKSLDSDYVSQLRFFCFLCFVVQSFHQLHAKEFSQLSKPYQHLALLAHLFQTFFKSRTFAFFYLWQKSGDLFWLSTVKEIRSVDETLSFHPGPWRKS